MGKSNSFFDDSLVKTTQVNNELPFIDYLHNLFSLTAYLLENKQNSGLEPELALDFYSIYRRLQGFLQSNFVLQMRNFLGNTPSRENYDSLRAHLIENLDIFALIYCLERTDQNNFKALLTQMSQERLDNPTAYRSRLQNFGNDFLKENLGVKISGRGGPKSKSGAVVETLRAFVRKRETANVPGSAFKKPHKSLEIS
jgi:hypothetical protein